MVRPKLAMVFSCSSSRALPSSVLSLICIKLEATVRERVAVLGGTHVDWCRSRATRNSGGAGLGTNHLDGDYAIGGDNGDEYVVMILHTRPLRAPPARFLPLPLVL